MLRQNVDTGNIVGQGKLGFGNMENAIPVYEIYQHSILKISYQMVQTSYNPVNYKLKFYFNMSATTVFVNFFKEYVSTSLCCAHTHKLII